MKALLQHINPKQITQHELSKALPYQHLGQKISHTIGQTMNMREDHLKQRR